ncbi:MAG: hypothetical protein WB762_34455 [Candidatus Sulfotelmatobacter sp.]
MEQVLECHVLLEGSGHPGACTKNDWPRYVEEEPEVYEREDLDTLFAACDAQGRLGFEFFLMTGMREQEVMHCSWDDINLSRSTITVRYKPEYGFSPKNYKEREIDPREAGKGIEGSRRRSLTKPVASSSPLPDAGRS